jgi:hypothetical protein
LKKEAYTILEDVYIGSKPETVEARHDAISCKLVDAMVLGAVDRRRVVLCGYRSGPLRHHRVNRTLSEFRTAIRAFIDYDAAFRAFKIGNGCDDIFENFVDLTFRHIPEIHENIADKSVTGPFQFLSGLCLQRFHKLIDRDKSFRNCQGPESPSLMFLDHPAIPFSVLVSTPLL